MPCVKNHVYKRYIFSSQEDTMSQRLCQRCEDILPHPREHLEWDKLYETALRFREISESLPIM